MAGAGRQGWVSSGCGRSSGVPLKISMITPRSRSVPRYATLAPPNSPLRNHAVPAVGLRNGLVEVRSGDGDMVDALALLARKRA